LLSLLLFAETNQKENGFRTSKKVGQEPETTENDRVSSPSNTLLHVRESGEMAPFLCRRNLAIAQTWHATTMKIMITVN